MCRIGLDSMFKLLACSHVDFSDLARIWIVAIRHIYLSDVLYTNFLDILRRNTNRGAQARRAQMGQKRSMGQLKSCVWQRIRHQMVVTFWKAQFQFCKNNQIVWCLINLSYLKSFVRLRFIYFLNQIFIFKTFILRHI